MKVLTEQEARELTAAIREGVAAASRAFTGLAWQALGYATWPAYCDAEIGASLKINIEDRRTVVGELRRQGKTHKKIAREIGISQPTVYRDLAALDAVIHVNKSAQSPLPQVITRTDGKERPASRRAAASKYQKSIPLIREYLELNPDATRNGTAVATGVDKSMVTKIARELGHTWAKSGPPKEAVKKGGQRTRKGPNKPEPPLRLSQPGYTFAHEAKQIAQFERMINALASDNGRMHYAQHVSAAMREQDTQWLAEQRTSLEHVIAYIGDLLRCHNDEAFRNRLNSGWEGRDDIAEQQVSAPHLRVVSAT